MSANSKLAGNPLGRWLIPSILVLAAITGSSLYLYLDGRPLIASAIISATLAVAAAIQLFSQMFEHAKGRSPVAENAAAILRSPSGGEV